MIVGLIGLLLFQALAQYSLHSTAHLSGKAGVIKLLLMTIGKAYEWASAIPESTNIFQKLLGNVIGVGFCEEMTKLLPLFWFVLSGGSRSAKVDYRSFLILAFFSGLGFGIGEAIHGYAPWTGNPLVGSNVLRWFACVPSHAIYTVIDASFLWLLAPKILEARNNFSRFGLCALTVFVAALVHGIYNVLNGPLMGPLLDGLSILIMYFVIVWVAKKTELAELVTQRNHFSPKGIVGWLVNEKVGSMRFGRIYVVSSAMICGSLVFSTSLKSIQGMQQESFSDDYGASDYGYQVNQTDRLVLKNFEEVMGVTSILGNRNGLNSFEILRAAMDTMDWSDASPQLKKAVNEVKSIRNGESRESGNKKIQMFEDVYSKY